MRVEHVRALRWGRTAAGSPTGHRRVDYCGVASAEVGFQVGQDGVQVRRVLDVVDDGLEERRRSWRSA